MASRTLNNWEESVSRMGGGRVFCDSMLKQGMPLVEVNNHPSFGSRSVKLTATCQRACCQASENLLVYVDYSLSNIWLRDNDAGLLSDV